MSEAEHLCDRVVLLINGRIIVVGTPEELRSKYGEGQNISLFVDQSCNKAEIDELMMLKIPNIEKNMKMVKNTNEILYKINSNNIELD